MEELRETTEALQKAAVNYETFSNIQTLSTVRVQLLIKHMQDDISGVEERSGSRLPGVECGASFSDMSAGINPHSCLIFPLFCLFFFRRKHVHPQFVLTLFCPLRLD